MTAPTRPVLRWHGGKWKLAPWIISHFPPHRVYVEPFGGAASVLLRKDRASAEVLNDADRNIVNLFQVIRERHVELTFALTTTPYARDEYERLYEVTDDPLESARRFVARSFMGFGSKGAMIRSGFDGRLHPDAYISAVGSFIAVPGQLETIAGRLVGVAIENVDALTLFDRYDRPDALFYVDPPYLPETRSGEYYIHEFSKDQHCGLLKRLQNIEGMVVLSGYPSTLYDDGLQGWWRIEMASRSDGARPRTEVLWLNPACTAALARRHAGGDFGLFRSAAE